MGYGVQQECPQCGAPISLEETDRLISCPFCNVQSFIANTDTFHFILPARNTSENIIYAPYIRFKGSVFSCEKDKVDYRILDVTHPAFSHACLPSTLGFRPQTQKLHFSGPDFHGSFLPCQITLDEALDRVNKNPLRRSPELSLHTTHIGESFSIIYLPLKYTGGELHDMVTDSPLGKVSEDDPLFSASNEGPKWQPVFLATLCPSCGWNLKGEKDSLVLFCNNCDTAWETKGSSLGPVAFQTCFATGTDSKKTLLLPFWRLTVEGKGVDLHSFADFMRLTNQPRIIKPEWKQTKLSFICPAFKITPKSFLRLAGQMTLSQHKFSLGQAVLPAPSHPVNLPESEARESLKIILASTAVAKKNLMPLIPQIDFNIVLTKLLLIPFKDNGQGYYQEDLEIEVNKNALQFGRHL